jgi:hypothetical protein
MESVFGEPFAQGDVVIVVPHTRDFDKPLSEAEHDVFVERVGGELAALFGGAQGFAGVGWYISPITGASVRERVTNVVSYCNPTEADEAKVKVIARKLASDLGQETVLVRVNGNSYFVAPF